MGFQVSLSLGFAVCVGLVFGVTLVLGLCVKICRGLGVVKGVVTDAAVVFRHINALFMPQSSVPGATLLRGTSDEKVDLFTFSGFCRVFFLLIGFFGCVFFSGFTCLYFARTSGPRKASQMASICFWSGSLLHKLRIRSMRVDSGSYLQVFLHCHCRNFSSACLKPFNGAARIKIHLQYSGPHLFGPYQ